MAAGAAGAAAGSVGLNAAALSSRAGQTFQIGYQIFGWGRYFPSAWWRGAAETSAIGYPGIEGEYTIAQIYQGREEEFRDKMEGMNLRLSALYSTTDLERPAERYVNIYKNLKAAEFCRKMGAETLVLGGTEVEERSPEAFRIFAETANELGKRTFETHGVRCGVHPHRGSFIETREHIERAMQDSDPRFFFLAPDTAHLVAGGSDPVEVFETYRSRINHVHVKDYLPDPSTPARGSVVPLGWGTIDFPKLFEILKEESFAGWANVELDSAVGLTQGRVAELAFEYLVRLGLQIGKGSN
ncbi:MAG TPA: sugar phosphate isomerase/epimerase family protein [Acidobacteriota bacterium]|nr:sugar phosphate isomerase/epimerase family protein [Acidobacteriota bacterium]